MQPTVDSDLSAGDYRIAPSEKLREEYGVPIGDVLAGDFSFLSGEDDEEGFHKYDVEREDGTVVLEVYETHGSAAVGWLPFSLPQYVYLFIELGGEPVFVLEVDHSLTPSYTVQDPETEQELASVTKSWGIVGSWQLVSPAGTVRATADRTNTLGNLFSFSTHATYDVTGPDGGDVGQFERVRSEGDFIESFRSAMDVDASRSSVAPAELLALAFALLYEGEEKTSSGGGGGGGD